MNLPTELIYIIYNYSDIATRIKLNKIFNISFYILNPLQNNLNKVHPKLEDKINIFKFIHRGH
jgi:hypothetical protein